MHVGERLEILYRRLVQPPVALAAQRRRQYETFTLVYLITALCFSLFVMPLFAWLGGGEAFVYGVLGFLACIGALLGHRQGHITLAAIVLVSVLMAQSLLGIMLFGPVCGFGYYFWLVLLILYLSDFTSPTKVICAAGFLLLFVSITLHMQVRAPLFPLPPEMIVVVRVVNLTILTVVSGAILLSMERVVHRLEHAYRHSATLDSLTAVLNRRGIMAEGERHHQQGWSYAVMLIDVDHFKRINDTYGHATGDEVLRHLVRCMRKSLRDDDCIGRVGGEEFLVFLREMPLDGAEFVAERLREHVEQSACRIKGRKLSITVSIGVAVSGSDLSLAAVIDQADQRLYQAKRQGRNQTVCGEAFMPEIAAVG